MAEMLEFVYSQRREDLIKVNDIVNFIYKSSHICRSCYILLCLDFVACSVVVVKAVPLQAWSGPEGARKLRFPDFMKTAQDGGKIVGLKHRPSLPTGNTPCTLFC